MSVSADVNDNANALDAQAINNFREYLQIPSVHPNVNYDDCVKFLENQAKSLGLPCRTYQYFPGKPIVVITWVGQEPALPSILLNSHMDVVPVFEEKWTHKPFNAHMDDEGNIYARGTQDMKCVGIQYLEAVRRLKLEGVTLKRTIHMSFMPDEEIGGVEGMKEFVKTQDFKNLKIGFALDEGMASVNDDFVIFYGERGIWRLHIHCPGQPGHGSLLLENTAGEKLQYILDKFFHFREQEMKKLKDNPSLALGDVTTVNLTQLKGGIQTNVIPPEFVAVFDCRIPASVDVKKWEETVNQWCKEAGDGVWIKYELKESPVADTTLDDSNLFWIAFKGAADKLNLQLKPIICPGATDARFVRTAGSPAIGFSPITNTRFRLHSHNEYLNANTFLLGIGIYSKLVTAIANL